VILAIILREQRKIKTQLNSRKWKTVNPVENVGNLVHTAIVVCCRFYLLYTVQASTLHRIYTKNIDTNGVNG
jgi:hypothetical protein